MATNLAVQGAAKAPAYDLGPDDLAADLRLPEVEGRVLKATLVTRIRAVVGDRGLTQVKAGEIMGLPQPKVSELINGGASGFSVERLFALLNKLGVSVSIGFHEEPAFALGETSFVWDREDDASVDPEVEGDSLPAFAMG